MLQRFLRDEERDDLALGNLDVREVRDGLRIDEAEMKLVVFDGQPEPVAHEVDVALDGLGRNLQFVGQLPAVGEIAGDELVVQPHHALQRGTGELRGAG